jgi:hypothetical protein
MIVFLKEERQKVARIPGVYRCANSVGETV